MIPPRRSTTGCAVCKARRKKCDEAKPQCLRCLASGRLCSYDYVESSEGGKHRVKRTKPAPRSTLKQLARASRSDLAGFLEADNTPSSASSASGNSVVLAHPALPEAWNAKTHLASDLVAPRNNADSIPLPFTSLACLRLPSDTNSHHPPHTSSDPFQLPINQIRPHNIVPVTWSLTPQASARLGEDEDEDDEDNNDPEGVRLLLCTTPYLDKNAKDNSLPFVLRCYSQWAIARVFEPLKIVHAMRDRVIAQFADENTRSRTILIANVMNTFVKDMSIDATRKSILNRLVMDVRKTGSYFIATPPSSTPGLDKQNAMHLLDNMLEIHALQTTTQHTASCMQLLDYIAPVFRRACPEMTGKVINLANVLMEPTGNTNLQHFATIDIMRSVTTGLPTYFRYEISSPIELCDQFYYAQQQGNHGAQWLYGLSEQYIMFFVWINNLCEKPGASESSELITWIESQISQIKIAIDQSGDPMLRIGRMVVQECWRFAVLIYLYMVLCKASAYDPRVVRTQKGFMRLIGGVKPARNPDAHLFVTMVIIGVATHEERDRDTLRRRILGVRECAEQGTTSNDVMRGLEDVWQRTRDEGRPAIWADLRKASLSVTGR
ncbi:unnamed protein product [Rhizoctonia solani]|uniref:Zn(2)-C6 fungal-type domain-containing protein n=1 Tax=Rhizoctonia solani TaxID=456999 RepID=A0A8H3DGV9_9AGAM|nr:unnamed protein product [Rhizoctonia solani]